MIFKLWKWECVVQLSRGKHPQMIGYFTFAIWRQGKAPGFFYAMVQTQKGDFDPRPDTEEESENER